MKKFTLLLSVSLLFSFYSYAEPNGNPVQYDQRQHFENFNDFYQSLPLLTIPFDTHNLDKGQYVDSKFFHFDKGDYRYYDKPSNNEQFYFTLQDLTAVGRFEIDNTRFVLYHFTFDSEGEGFLEDLYILNAFNQDGEYLDELILSAHTGHEDHIFDYSTLVFDNLFNVHIADHYALIYMIDVVDNVYHTESNANITYQFSDNQFQRKQQHPNCTEFNLNGYLAKLTKQQFAYAEDIVAFDDYLTCYPIFENLKIYKKLASYLENSHRNFLSSYEFKKLNNVLKTIKQD